MLDYYSKELRLLENINYLYRQNIQISTKCGHVIQRVKIKIRQSNRKTYYFVVEKNNNFLLILLLMEMNMSRCKGFTKNIMYFCKNTILLNFFFFFFNNLPSMVQEKLRRVIENVNKLLIMVAKRGST